MIITFFKKILPREFCESYEVENSNLYNCIKYIYKFDLWIQSQIVTEFDINKRGHKLEFFIKLAMRCLEYSNFNCAFCIYSSLVQSSIKCLTSTMKNLSQSAQNSFKKLEESLKVQNGWSNYRSLIELSGGGPSIPIFVYLISTISKIIEGNNFCTSDKIPENVVNVDAYRLITNQIKVITNLQSNPYNFEIIPDFFNYFMNLKHLGKEEIEINSKKIKESEKL